MSISSHDIFNALAGYIPASRFKNSMSFAQWCSRKKALFLERNPGYESGEIPYFRSSERDRSDDFASQRAITCDERVCVVFLRISSLIQQRDLPRPALVDRLDCAGPTQDKSVNYKINYTESSNTAKKYRKKSALFVLTLLAFQPVQMTCSNLFGRKSVERWAEKGLRIGSGSVVVNMAYDSGFDVELSGTSSVDPS
ncbi:hypothetical protein BDF20DRAFT_988004 [Mycotypha africana]|uniref:uncharacterized protein n=1 Tax=Mycotypha africana TaxID=64632 RepID=UPI002300F7A2|nr:uncharacterized protein BDF20DRAFT_988004 [Mycotypha africana]KAI8979831.1 hypothetical protein BDF20DRAFT_988004 [Mycotypha africana]